MTCSNEAARPCGEQRERVFGALEKIDTRLYYLKHLCTLVACAAGADKGPEASAVEINAESLEVTFAWIAELLEEIRGDAMQPLRDAAKGGAR